MAIAPPPSAFFLFFPSFCVFIEPPRRPSPSLIEPISSPLPAALAQVVPREALSVFDYQELELLISGVPEIDLDDWRRHTR